MMDYEPKELSAPYIKQKSRRKSGVGRFIFLILVVVCIAGLFYIYFHKPSTGFLAFIFRGHADKTEESTTQTTASSFSQWSTTSNDEKTKSVDLSAAAQGERYENKSGYDTDSGFTASLGKIGNGRVLFVATRGYEGYAESGSGVSYGGENTAELAAFMAEEMNKHGINAAFLNICPEGDYSYENAYKKISEYLEEHTDVRYIIDISREALCSSAGELLRPAVKIDGVEYAQMRLAVGTDAGGGAHPGWRTRLMQADAVFDMMSGKYPTLMMSTLISQARLNQHLPRCTLTLRIGSLGNSFAEAKNTAQLFACAFAEAIK